MTSPGLPRCCLPPALMTAYMLASDRWRGRAPPCVSRAGTSPALRLKGEAPPRPASQSVDVVGDEDATSLAGRAGLRERLEQPGRDALAGHLEQPERADVEHLGPRLVLGQRVLHRLHDLRLVLFEHHVDEVDDDHAADVAEP